MPRDILKTLKEEHDQLRTLFKEMEATTDRGVKTRNDLLRRIDEGLLPHAKWVEQVFYPRFAERADRDWLKTLAEALQEHHAVEHSVMPDVHAADFDTPKFAGRAKVFGEQIDHHAKEEEKTMFKMAREMFSAEERAQMDEEYEAWKKSPQAATAIAAAAAETGAKAVLSKLKQ
jgi:hemerythrin-like domain-containing protein